MPDGQAHIRRLWDLLNAHAFQDAGALLHPEVDWEGMLEAKRLRGPAEVIAYWGRMIEYIRPESTILDLETRADGSVVVHMNHVLRRPGGALWTTEEVTQIFRFRDRLIVGMDAV